jgi:hypothetical protein
VTIGTTPATRNTPAPIRRIRSSAWNGRPMATFATDRPISFREARANLRSRDYEFIVCEIRMGGNGVGEGKLANLAKVSYDKKRQQIEIEGGLRASAARPSCVSTSETRWWALLDLPDRLRSRRHGPRPITTSRQPAAVGWPFPADRSTSPRPPKLDRTTGHRTAARLAGKGPSEGPERLFRAAL